MKSLFVMLAGYNAWANRRLCDAAEKFSDADYRADRGVFFKSMHGTLNHLLVADRIWMRRFTGEGDHPDRLDATHVFNHQTHHRGQAHAVLTGLTGAAPSFDLVLFQRETGLGLDA